MFLIKSHIAPISELSILEQPRDRTSSSIMDVFNCHRRLIRLMHLQWKGRFMLISRPAKNEIGTSRWFCHIGTNQITNYLNRSFFWSSDSKNLVIRNLGTGLSPLWEYSYLMSRKRCYFLDAYITSYTYFFLHKKSKHADLEKNHVDSVIIK